MKLINKGLLVLAGLFVITYLAGWNLSKPKFDGKLPLDITAQITVAPIEQAITLGVTSAGEILLVTNAGQQGVSAISLGGSNAGYLDAIDAYLDIGRGKLLTLAATAESKIYPWESLSIPVVFGDKIVAAGTNFTAHAAEVSHAGEPFLFPKLSTPSSWNAAVADGGRLDHEVEICAVPLSDYHVGDKIQLAYLLCGDYTDRWLLVKDMDVGGEMGKTGFARGKGGATHLPVGALLVIPAADDFYQEIVMKLYVNNDLRQHSKAGLMIWNPMQILERTLTDCNTVYKKLTEEIRLLNSCDKVPAKTLVLTGTPEGTMFHIATLWNPLFYLASGDVVTAYATYLGITKNTVQ
jgi:2-keto-4-pentenoate hydratase/2-oxohepta-3-ene-1,7-dioic acid hydratase in catechol pathway